MAWSRTRRHLARLCALLAIVSALAAAAQPTVAVAPARREGILVLAIDVSGSTAADDVAPIRLGAVQAATLRLLDKVPPRVRVGLVSFSSTAGTLARPTADRDAVRRQIGALKSFGGTVIDHALRVALNDIVSSHRPAPARVLLISDGATTAGGDPAEVARIAAARHVPVLAVAVGTPDGTVMVVDETGALRRVPIPPDLAGLNRVAAASGGHAVAAGSAAELESGMEDLLAGDILGPEQRDVSLLFAAAALLLLAIGRALTASRRAGAPAPWAAPPATGRRWTLPVALLVATAVATAGWVWSAPVDPPPASERTLAVAAPPLPVAPAPRTPAPPFVAISATKVDRVLVQQATRLLRAHGALATQRTAEIRRQHLTAIAELEVSACDVCVTEALTSPGSGSSTIGGQPVCELTLNTRFVREHAQRARVPVRTLAAMAMFHEQELCLGSPVPYAAEQRLAAKLRNPLLLDLLYAQVDAGPADWNAVEEAVAILREHAELAFQRHDELQGRHLNKVGPLWITACRGCRDDRGLATTGLESQGVVGCDIVLDLSVIGGDARAWGLSITQAIASALVHEQEHCIRNPPDDRETPALDQERRLARKLGSARLLEYITALYSDLDRTGHWKS
jgi:Ca-activated chloride channel homolog